MPAETEANAALDLIAADDFKPGSKWAAAHEIAQDHEGEPVFDAIHALLHRIEGDLANAGYWDRRAGTDFGNRSLQAEFDALRAFISKGV